MELRSRKLVKPMTLEDLNVFREEMYKRLEFKSHSEPPRSYLYRSMVRLKTGRIRFPL